MKEVTIKIPTKPEFKRWWEITKFKALGGFVCSECGTKMFFDNIEITSTVKGKRFLFHDWCFKTPLRCPHCIQKEIDANASRIFTELHKCDWCGENHPTVTFFNFHEYEDIKTHFTIGSQWWNGHYICQSCMHEGLENGVENMGSSIHHWDKKTGKTYPANRLGILKK